MRDLNQPKNGKQDVRFVSKSIDGPPNNNNHNYYTPDTFFFSKIYYLTSPRSSFEWVLIPYLSFNKSPRARGVERPVRGAIVFLGAVEFLRHRLE